MDYDVMAREFDGGRVFFNIQHESNPLTTNELSMFDETLEQLSNIDNCTYYEIYAQPLYQKDMQLFDTETIRAIQISANVQNDFGLCVSEGRMLDRTDFVIQKKTIPVMIGADYKNTIKVGDSFTAEYLFDDYEFIVVGILEENSAINISNGTYLLNGYVIMPSFRMAEDLLQTDGMFLHYANKVSGQIGTDAEYVNAVLKELNNILENAKSGSYSINTTSTDINLKNMIGIDIRTIVILSVSMIIILTIGLLFLYRTIILDTRRFLMKLVWIDIIAYLLNSFVIKAITLFGGLPYNFFLMMIFAIYPILLYELYYFMRKLCCVRRLTNKR